MSVELILANVARYLAQTLILIAAAEASMRIARLRAPSVRLAILHAVLIGCALLPFQQVRRPMIGRSDGGSVTIDTRVRGPVPAVRVQITPQTALFAIAAGGALFRLLWLGAGLLRLRSRRRRARALLPVPLPVEQAERALGIRADYYVVPTLPSPVAFGAAILLPERFCDLAPEAQRVVATHELLHVKRRDWLAVLGEETIRALLWWNPAVWWLLNQIQLAREQAIDQQVVEIACDRDSYLEALLEMASIRIEPGFAPAPLFLRRRHLRERVALIVDGGFMSKRRLTVSLAFVLVLLPVAAGLAMQTMPLQGPPQTDAPGVQVFVPAQVLQRTGIPYPAAALRDNIGGIVVVQIRPDAKGSVAGAAVLRGPEVLRSAVLDAVTNWQFDPAAGLPEHFDLMIAFTPPSSAANTPSPVQAVYFDSLPPDLRGQVAAAFPIRPGDRPGPAELQAAERALAAIDDRLYLGEALHGGAEREMFVALRGSSQPAPPAERSGPNLDRIRVGGNVAAVNLLHKVTPVYPPDAKQARIQGKVRLTAVIDREGKIIDLQLVSGHPLLAESAIEAVRQWIYTPTLLNGEPVQVVTDIDINYTLSQ